MSDLFCASCGKLSCKNNDLPNAPENCPSIIHNNIPIEVLYDEDDMKIAKVSAIVEAENYCKNTRVEEIMDFAYKSGYKKIGLAFCFGLRKEANIFTSILGKNGFEIESVICKNGGFDKSNIGVEDEHKLCKSGFECMCNPIGQAKRLNEVGTQFNVLLGLCVGHDSLFFKYSNAPVTVLAVKDRILGHNPLACLYQVDMYYKKLNSFIKDKYPEGWIENGN